jgi:hypothetical protein
MNNLNFNTLIQHLALQECQKFLTAIKIALIKTFFIEIPSMRAYKKPKF